MELLKILKDVEILSVNGQVDIDIEDISYDSRKVKQNSMFLCIRGNTVDGHNYIDDAIQKGASNLTYKYNQIHLANHYLVFRINRLFLF